MTWADLDTHHRANGCYRLVCYGDTAAHLFGFQRARMRMLRHLRVCPKGPMPWARRITWHLVHARDLNTYHRVGPVWVTSAGGEWLNHHLVPEPRAKYRYAMRLYGQGRAPS